MLRSFDALALHGVLLWPAFGAMFVFLVRPGASRRREAGASPLVRLNALTFAATEAMLVALVIFRKMRGGQLHYASDWIRAGLGLDFALDVDALSAVFAALTAVVSVVAILASRMRRESDRPICYALVLLAEAAFMGVFCAADVLVMLLFAELAAVCVYVLARLWPAAAAPRGTTGLIVANLLGGVLLLSAAIALAWMHYRRTSLLSFAFADLLYFRPSLPQRAAVAVTLLAGLGLKAGAFGCHAYLRAAARARLRWWQSACWPAWSRSASTSCSASLCRSAPNSSPRGTRRSRASPPQVRSGPASPAGDAETCTRPWPPCASITPVSSWWRH